AGKKLTKTAVKGWGDVNGAINGNGVKSDGERKIAQRNVAQRKGQCQGIERAGGQPRKNGSRDHQTVAVNERQEDEQSRKRSCSRQQNAAWSDETTQIHSERADEHQPDVVGSADPCAFVEPKSLVPFEVWKAERNHPARQRYQTCADDDSQNPE